MHAYGEKFEKAVKRVCRMHVRLRILFSAMGILLVYLCIPVIHAARGETPLFDKLSRQWNLYLGLIMLGVGLIVILFSLVYRLPSIIVYLRVKERTILISQYTDGKDKATKRRWVRLRRSNKPKEIISLATSYWVLANRFAGKGKRKEGDSRFDGKVYQKLFKVKYWKDYIPSISAFDKKNLSRDITTEYIEQYLLESIRAELCHDIIILFDIIFIILTPHSMNAKIITWAVIANLPCIIIQRYNRPRFEALAKRSLKNQGRK